MEAIFVPAGELPQLRVAMQALEQNDAAKGALVLMADKAHFTQKEIGSVLGELSLSVMGGVFPEVMFAGTRMESGTVIVPLENELRLARIDISHPTADFESLLSEAFGKVTPDTNSLFVFCDALAPGKSRFIETLYNHFGHLVSYLGGGAGSLSFQSFPCILDHEGLHTHTAVVALSSKRIAIGVAHGWHSITEPMKVTKTQGNKVLSINWRPAFEVYRQVVEQHSGRQFTGSNFFDIAKSYPLGIARIDAEHTIRDPFMSEDEALHIVDIIHEGEFVSIMHGDMDSLLSGAQKASDLSTGKAAREQDQMFCIDCISRVLFMQDEFQREIDLIGKGSPVAGALTIGEIANDGAGYLEMFNKTVVVARW